eukprot:gnl/MRDRNA2_/MRDRNA2_125069_c0_seq1.p2 gnl/MRDRNA2_/MRDRNA2_125069_c0~~gnl/MRDRNA2_/MRDRNA2_125069_c0_seq1.p2  ORF type:complete len:103 (+),score=21.54 gnl/MRDRNA2_/MRDRNA2_125069_c0_seq1:90-398(+)
MSVAPKFRPLLDRVLVKKVTASAKSAGGIFLPDSAKKEINQAMVLACGPGRRDKQGALIPMSVKVGDKVVIPQYGGTECKFDGEDYHIYRDEDMVGIVKDEE